MSITLKCLFVSSAIAFLSAAVFVYRDSALVKHVKSFIKQDWFSNQHETQEHLFTTEELEQYDGRGGEDSPLYLAVLGLVFDVSAGRRHYAPGKTYNFFVGGDRSRSFITGDFSTASAQHQEVLDLSCRDLLSLQHWVDTYYKQYVYKGKLLGLHYDESGRATEYSVQLSERRARCAEEAQVSERSSAALPPCNVRWDADSGTRVWCTRNSGGVSRAWTGRPRQLYESGAAEARCVCAPPPDQLSASSIPAASLQPYPHCPLTATECYVHT